MQAHSTIQCQLQIAWRCRDGCGECCGCVPLPAELWSKYHSRWNIRRNIKEKHKVILGGKAFWWLVTEDGKCVFLNENKSCAIYEERPAVCQMYGKIPDLPCPYVDFNGRHRSLDEAQYVASQIDADMDKRLQELKQMIADGKYKPRGHHGERQEP